MIIFIFHYFYSCTFCIVLMCNSIIQWLTYVKHIIPQHFLRKKGVWPYKSVFYIANFVIQLINTQ